jgi:hypothetical protein
MTASSSGDGGDLPVVQVPATASSPAGGAASKAKMRAVDVSLHAVQVTPSSSGRGAEIFRAGRIWGEIGTEQFGERSGRVAIELDWHQRIGILWAIAVVD